MSLFFYNVFLALYAAGIRLASFRNRKAKSRLQGCATAFAEAEAWRREIGDEQVIWMHCASLGEFEQGRPVAEALKKLYPSHKLLISFFSASGYEVRKNYRGADMILYLPADGKRTANAFIDIIKPALVIWVKYEYWYYYLVVLQQKNIPLLLISARFREEQPFFTWYGSLWRKMLASFQQIFVQDATSERLLKKYNLAANAVVSGDTRFDRVIEIANGREPLPSVLQNFCAGSRVIVAGSTWEEDEEELVHYLRVHPAVKMIIAPHEIDAERLADVKKLFTGAAFYSALTGDAAGVQVVVIDNIGMLSALYALADIAYIGGGFNDSGIHNITEAAVYGKPIIFGPNYEKFTEATALADRGGAFSISNALELEALLDKLFNDKNLLRHAGEIAGKYIYDHSGATQVITRYIQENRLLTS